MRRTPSAPYRDIPFQRRLEMTAPEVEAFFRLPSPDEVAVVWPGEVAPRDGQDYLFVRRATADRSRDTWWVKLRPARGGKGARWSTGATYDESERLTPARRPQLDRAKQAYLAFLASERRAELGAKSPKTLFVVDVLADFVRTTVQRHETLKRITLATAHRVMDSVRRLGAAFDGKRIRAIDAGSSAAYLEFAKLPKTAGGLGIRHNTAAGDVAIFRRALETQLSTTESSYRAPFEIPATEKVVHGLFSPAEIGRVPVAAFEGRIWDPKAGDWRRRIDPATGSAVYDARPRRIARAALPYGRLFLLGLWFGSRPGVHLRLTWRDEGGGPWLDLDEPRLHRLGRAETATDKRKGSCPVPDAYLPTLRRWRDHDLAHGCFHVVHTFDFAPLARTDYKVWGALLEAAGVRRLGLHSCKHTLVQAARRAGVPLSSLAAYLFTTVKTLEERYGADWDEKLSEAAAAAMCDPSFYARAMVQPGADDPVGREKAAVAAAVGDPSFYARGWPAGGEAAGAGDLASTWTEPGIDEAAVDALEELDDAAA